jgi:hypothetical protein
MMFRNKIVSRPIAIVTGIVFLNLSFLYVEITVLDLEKKDRKLYDAIVTQLAGAGFEEEKDAAGETSTEQECDASLYLQSNSKLLLVKILIIREIDFHNGPFHYTSSYCQIFSPPPEGNAINT